MTYIPGCGDIIWVNLDPRTGREQAKRRPAIVLSPKSYNAKARLCVICPITSKAKGYPFETPIHLARTKGAVLCDHVRSIDWEERKIRFIEKAPDPTVENVLEKLGTLISYRSPR